MTLVYHDAVPQLLRSVDKIVQYILLHLVESSSPLIHSDWLTQPSRFGGCSAWFCNAWRREFVVDCHVIALARLLIACSMLWLCEMLFIALGMLLLVGIILNPAFRGANW